MKQLILDTIEDMVSNLLYYDRKEDEDLPVDAIEGALAAGEITITEMADHFRWLLEQALKP